MPKTEQAATLGDVLADRGLSIRAAAQLCEVSARLIEILVSGGVTLPSLAMQIGRCLGLTAEQVRPLGQALDRERFRKETGVVPLATDSDPEWWRRYRPSRDTSAVEKVYLNAGRLMEHILRLDGDMRMLYEITGGRTPAAINKGPRELRPQIIRGIEERLGLPPGALKTEKKPGHALELVFLPDREMIRKAMERQKVTPAVLDRTPPMYENEIYKILDAAKEGRAITIETMRKLATAMDVELCLLGRKIIRINNKGNRRSV